ncbi:glycosyltransferase family 4 protein [Sulfoacidibacillus thermotolerans]|uniref:Glycosyl transferase n=1 Tax=Sulfoacidibacillus thermotolerans TaxID=1765684 RepID=A0A2U3D814_SULT2|nr:glycosyltransferase family 1 protein [Sulfoacidibacillus thermotolerans]PWI57434.1 glycosyl transferase [Sulfoacidibacillus thermotolerans]
MKIALFTETFLPSTDGIVTRLCATVDHLLDMGHEVALIAPAGAPDFYRTAPVLSVKGFPYFFYPQKKFCLPSPKIGAFLAEFHPSLIHIVNPVVLGVNGIYYARKMHLPLVASFHTNLAAYAHTYGVPFLDPIAWSYLRLLHNQAILNLATSEAMVRELNARKFCNTRLWAGGVDTELFHPRKRLDLMRARLTNGEKDHPILLYVGRLAPEKQLERLRPLLDAMPKLHIAFVGDGPDRHRLERLFAHSNATFLGFLHGEELASAYASADLFLFPSTTETLGLVLLEAMSSGLPILAAKSKPSEELIGQTHAGLFFNPDEENSLQDAVHNLLIHPKMRDEFARKARHTIEARSWKAPTKALVDSYEWAIEAYRLQSELPSDLNIPV